MRRATPPAGEERSDEAVSRAGAIGWTRLLRRCAPRRQRGPSFHALAADADPAQQTSPAGARRRTADRDAYLAVFVGADTVWKLKKAVQLPFLDFTRVEDRHRFCSANWR